MLSLTVEIIINDKSWHSWGTFFTSGTMLGPPHIFSWNLDHNPLKLFIVPIWHPRNFRPLKATKLKLITKALGLRLSAIYLAWSKSLLKATVRMR